MRKNTSKPLYTVIKTKYAYPLFFFNNLVIQILIFGIFKYICNYHIFKLLYFRVPYGKTRPTHEPWKLDSWNFHRWCISVAAITANTENTITSNISSVANMFMDKKWYGTLHARVRLVFGRFFLIGTLEVLCGDTNLYFLNENFPPAPFYCKLLNVQFFWTF